MMQKYSRVRLFVLFAMLTFAFGGFTFYASIVVPIGTDVLDARTQGFVTQQVTHRINIANSILLIGLVWEWLASRELRSRTGNRAFIALTLLFGLGLGLLFYLHPQMDSLLDANQFSILDKDKFYFLHRVYLWTSTLQWLCLIGLIGMICQTRPQVVK